ncbi:MAG: hypothetical protein RLZZ324_1089 [Candidatus Parcubacteria bacterium]|jgi:NAD+ synthase (glutamine-hydrolysing)
MAGFKDVRNHGFVRVAVSVPRVVIGDPLANAEEYLRLMGEAADAGAYYLLFTELGLTGYTCGDLFKSETLQREAVEALGRIVGRSAYGKSAQILTTVGLPLVIDDALYNCAVTFQNGKLLSVMPKKYPPNYREFYEGRYFARSPELRRTTMTLLGQEVLVGTDILIEGGGDSGFILAVDNCEDMWVLASPGDALMLMGGTVRGNVSASNITLQKEEFREMLGIVASGKGNGICMYAAAGPGESTTDHAWDGHAFIAERGAILGRTERFPSDSTLLVLDADIRACTQDRIAQTSFHQNASDERMTVRRVAAPFSPRDDVRRDDAFETFKRTLDPHPFVPADPAERAKRCHDVFMIQATALQRRLECFRPQDRKIVVGISGGQDSTHALLIAAFVMDRMGLPRTNITGVTSPGFGTSGRTYKNSMRLMKTLGITVKRIPITGLATRMYADIGMKDPRNLKDEVARIVSAGLTDEASVRLCTTFENVQAWCRMHVLLATASLHGGIVLGTGDLSELMLGWCTMFGDHASHYGVNAGVPKTLISFMIAHSADVVFKKDTKLRKVLASILDTPISPELLPLDKQGNIAQKTSDKLGPYELHDYFGHAFIRFGFGPRRIARTALAAFDGRYSLTEIKTWLQVFLWRFFANQYKRSCLPDGPKVGVVSVSPRGDLRMPSDMTVAAWMREAETIPDDVQPLAA